jgi:hypothetical protein
MASIVAVFVVVSLVEVMTVAEDLPQPITHPPPHRILPSLHLQQAPPQKKKEQMYETKISMITRHNHRNIW